MFKTLKRIAIALEQHNLIQERIHEELISQRCYLKLLCEVIEYKDNN